MKRFPAEKKKPLCTDFFQRGLIDTRRSWILGESFSIWGGEDPGFSTGIRSQRFVRTSVLFLGF